MNLKLIQIKNNMVESSGSSGLLDVKLAQEWSKLAKVQEATSTFVKQSVQREI
jgi:hypothetical protein